MYVEVLTSLIRRSSHLLIRTRPSRSSSIRGLGSASVWLIGVLVLSRSLLVHRDPQGLGQLRVVLKIDAKLTDTAGSAWPTTEHISHHTIGAIGGSCSPSCAIVVTLENGRCEEHVSDHGDAHRHVKKVAVVALVRGVNKRLEFWHVVRVGKVDHIDSNIVLSEALA